MTGNNRRANAGRMAPPVEKKPQPQRKVRPRKVPKSGAINSSTSTQALVETNANVRPMNNRVTTLDGSDFAGYVEVKKAPATAADRILRSFAVSPSTFTGTRLAQLSELWERYRFTKFNVRYVPAVPSTMSCQLVCYEDTDPSDDPTKIVDADTLLRQAVSQAGAQQWNFTQTKMTRLSQRRDKQQYYTGPVTDSPRLTTQAMVYFLQVTNPLNFNGEAIAADTIQAGSVFIDWQVQFQTPQINPTALPSRVLKPTVPYTLNNGDLLPAGKYVVVPKVGIVNPDLEHEATLDAVNSGSGLSIVIWRNDQDSNHIVTTGEVTCPEQMAFRTVYGGEQALAYAI